MTGSRRRRSAPGPIASSRSVLAWNWSGGVRWLLARPPSVKRLVMKVIAEEATRLAALKRGEIDIAYSIRGELADELLRTPGLSLKPVLLQGVFCVYFVDQSDPKSPWHDLRVRSTNARSMRRSGNSASSTAWDRASPNGASGASPASPTPHPSKTCAQGWLKSHVRAVRGEAAGEGLWPHQPDGYELTLKVIAFAPRCVEVNVCFGIPTAESGQSRFSLSGHFAPKHEPASRDWCCG